MSFTTPRLAATLLLSLLLPLISTGCGPTDEPPTGESPAKATSPELEPNLAEELWHHRNLGKAFYENPATQYEAVGELARALEIHDSACERANHGMALLRAGEPEAGVAELERAQAEDPSLPHTWFNLGIAYKRASRYDAARAQFERMVELVPDEPISHFNLASLYKLEGRSDDARRHFERSAELDSNLAGPHFQLATLDRQAGRTEDAAAAMARFRERKALNEGAAVPEDLEWSFYAELCEVLEPENARDDAPPPELAFESRQLADGLDRATAGLELIDLGGNGQLELLTYDAQGVRLVDAAGTAIATGLDGLDGARHIAPADIDHDGLADLAIVRQGRAALWRQADGTFREDTAAGWPAADAHAAVWLDWDHDYDPDLILLGAVSTLLRNNGDGTWSDHTASFPFVSGGSFGDALAGVVFDVEPDTQGMDLAVLHAGGELTLYRDRLAGHYEPTTLPAVPGARTLTAFDVDHDGRTDLAAAGRDGVTLLLNRAAGFTPRMVTSTKEAPGEAAVFADLGNRGLSDLVLGGAVYRNEAEGHFATAERPAGLPEDPIAPAALATADLDQDGRIDLAAIGGDGALTVAMNRTKSPGRFLTVELEGRKNPPLAPGAEVEVKAGRLYQKKTYVGLPLHFGLGPRAEVDTVRITWPNGLIQNEARQAAGQLHHYVEAQRLSGSCPMIYTWNGDGFEFITDVLGVAPLGASDGEGSTFATDHDEIIQIPGEALRERDGRLEIRIVEELREVAYLDEIRLIAVDHPDDVAIFTNDKFKSPPFPEHRLFGVRQRHAPETARDHHGHDVRPRLLARDSLYPDDFSRRADGRAELHHLELGFGDVARDGRALLVLSGWVDWADGSTFLAAAQGQGDGLVFPRLEVRDADGHWRTVIEDMGIPAGKPKTIVVDLTDRFLSPAREVRLTTNLAVYWDEIFLSEDTAPPEVVETSLHPEDALLRFGGFAKVVVHPERKQPERFVYAERRSTAMWNPTPGLYTRYGDVTPLLGAIDDHLAILGSGDELRLLFDATALPAIAAGWRRDYLLFVDGWAKDGDANTLHSQTVEPLPYHAMATYPPADPDPPDAADPRGPEHELYRKTWNTRPALTLIRPLAEGKAP